jgi:hypothetical protein
MRILLTSDFAGYTVNFKMYRGLEHSADPDEIDDVEKFLNKTIPPLPEDEQSVL